jgi:hypothetical protein
MLTLRAKICGWRFLYHISAYAIGLEHHRCDFEQILEGQARSLLLFGLTAPDADFPIPFGLAFLVHQLPAPAILSRCRVVNFCSRYASDSANPVSSRRAE